MPIITPTYPAINSAHSVSDSTLGILIEEFTLAEEICMRILSLNASRITTWQQLLQPYPFFESFVKFIKIEILSPKIESIKKWDLYIRSKVRI